MITEVWERVTLLLSSKQESALLPVLERQEVISTSGTLFLKLDCESLMAITETGSLKCMGYTLLNLAP